jgi:hypothetical protein
MGSRDHNEFERQKHSGLGESQRLASMVVGETLLSAIASAEENQVAFRGGSATVASNQVEKAASTLGPRLVVPPGIGVAQRR